MNDPLETAASTRPSRPRRWRRRFLVGGGTLVVLAASALIAAPFIVEWLAPRIITRILEREFAGRAGIDAIHCSYGGAVTLDGLCMVDSEGRSVLRIRKLTADVSIWDALSGTYRVRARVERPELLLVEDANGAVVPALRPNERTRAARERARREAEGRRDPGEPIVLPDLFADIEVIDARVVLSLLGRPPEVIAGAGARLRIDGFEKPIALDVSGSAPVALAMKGEATVAKGGVLTPSAIRGSLDIRIDRSSLDRLSGPAREFLGVERLEGMIEGAGRYTFAAPGILEGSGSFRMTDLHLGGGRLDGGDVDVRNLALTSEFRSDAQGTGTQEVRLVVDDFFEAALDGVTEGIATPSGSARGSLRVAALVAGVTRAAGRLLPLREGYTLSGRATIASDWSARIGTDGLAAASCTLSARMQEIAGRDPRGKALPLDREQEFTLRADIEPGVALALHELTLRAGKIAVAAQGGLDFRAATLRDSQVTIDADLDDLSRKLASFLDLEVGFGGTARADLRATGSAGGARVEGDVKLAGLRATGLAAGDLGPIEMSGLLRADLSFEESGESRIESCTVDSDFLAAELSGRAAGSLLAPATLRPEASYRIRIEPEPLERRLGGLLPSLTALGGASVEIAGGGAWDGDAMRVTGTVTGKSLRAAIEDAGAIDLSELDTSYEITISGDGERIELRECVAGAGRVQVSPRGSATPIVAGPVRLALDAMRDGERIALERLELDSPPIARGTASLVTERTGAGDFTAEGRVRFEGNAAPLYLQAPGLEKQGARAEATGRWRFEADIETRGGAVVVSQELRVEDVTLQGYAVRERAVSVRDAWLTVATVARVLESSAGSVEIDKLRVEAPGVRFEGNGSVAGLALLGAEAGAPLALRLDARGDLDPVAANAHLAPFLAGYALEGEPLTTSVEVRIRDRTLSCASSVACPNFAILLPPGTEASGGRRLAQEDLAIRAKLEADLAPGRERVDIESLAYTSESGRLEVEGTIAGFDRPTADLVLEAESRLERLVADLGALVGLDALDARGQLEARYVAKGEAGRIAAKGETKLTGLHLRIDGIGAEKKTLLLDEPVVVIAEEATLDAEKGTIEIAEGRVTSEVISGSVTGRILDLRAEPRLESMTGSFTYNPERLGAVLEPWLPGTLSGSAPAAVTLNVSGKVTELDPVALLRGFTGDADAALARFTSPAVTTLGTTSVALSGGRARATGRFEVNEGSAEVDADVDLGAAAGSRSTLRVKGEGVRANSEIAKLLELVHPIFHLSRDALDGVIEGKIDCDLELAWAAPIDLEQLRAGWEALPKRPIQGRGHVAVSEFQVVGTPLIDEALKILALDGREKIELNPVDFTIRDGRVSYDRPMQMKVGGQKTLWTGSIGLDRTLDMQWELPISERMLEKNPSLEFVPGGKLILPVRGTVKRPDVRFADALADLAKRGAEEGLGKAVEKGLDDLLGTGKKNDEAERLLAEADLLWDSGKRAEAQALYRRVRDDFKHTLAYRLAKDRIKRRMGTP